MINKKWSCYIVPLGSIESVKLIPLYDRMTINMWGNPLTVDKRKTFAAKIGCVPRNAQVVFVNHLESDNVLESFKSVGVDLMILEQASAETFQDIRVKAEDLYMQNYNSIKERLDAYYSECR